MAQYEHLPIYKKAFDMTIYIENAVRGFSRYHKYTLGTDLRDISRTVANNTNNAWIVNMWNGNVNNNNKSNNNNYVWPVRSGEWLTPRFSFETLYRSYLKCRRSKRGTINALRFEIKAEENLFQLLEQ